MKNTLLKRILSFLIVAAMVFSIAPHTYAHDLEDDTRWQKTDQQISVDLSDRLANIDLDDQFAPDEIVRVSIVLEEKSTLEAGFSTMNIATNTQAMAYNKKLQKKQETIEQTISRVALDGQALDVVWNLTLVGNIISANVPYGKIAQIEQVDGVAGVVLENMYEPYEVEAENDISTNQFATSIMTGFNQVWSNGYTGAGSRIAVIDTGTDTDHLSFDNGAFLYALEQNALAQGLSVEEYITGLDLLDAEELAGILPHLNIYERDDYLTADDLYLNEKLAFAVNYVDGGEGRLNVTHDNDYQSAHGSHVAGISTANRFVPSDNGYVDALKSVLVAGVAPDAQLITMKVFGNAALRDSDYMAAIEDAILLGCDSVNLSLGTVVAGYAFNSYYSELLDFMSNSDTVVVASAGNEGKWTDMTMFGTPYSDDVTFDTIGAPGSYANFFTVASVDNDGIVNVAFSVDGWNYTYTENTDYGNWPLTDIDISADGSGTAYEYILIDGLGYEEDYAGMDLTGKVVFCSRGATNFSAKANTAVSLGAVAVIIYNNTSGSFGMDLSGYYYSAPCVSIPQEYADQIRVSSTAQTTDAGLAYYTGEITIYGSPQAGYFNSEYYTMSEFSSWGVPGDLSIKPEITAPGGLIYSVYGSTPELYATDEYGLMSGTSMAAPQVAGMVALLAQYIRESGLAETTGLSPRVLAQSLLMSTAVPMLEQASDSYYSILQQGSGLARVDLATLATSYIMVAGQDDGKVKAELGDDPERTGVYEFSFTINNLTDAAQAYTLDAALFRQGVYDPGEIYGTPYGFTVQDTSTAALPGNAVFTVNGQTILNKDALAAYDLNGDGTTDSLDADYLLEYLLGNEAELYADGDINGDSNVNTYDAHCLLALQEGNSLVTVPSGGSVTVEVQLILTDAAKQELDRMFADGAYIQAYVFAEQITAEEGVEGTNHSIPVLAFYGNWTDPNMFDRGVYVEMMYGISDMLPYLYQVIGNGNALTIDYGDGNEYYFGGNPLMQDDAYLVERNAFNSQDASYLKAQYFSLIRNAGDTQLEIVNKETGEVYFSLNTGAFYSAFYNSSYGVWENTQQGVNLFWTGDDTNGQPVPEGTVIEVRFTAAPEYNLKADGTYDYDALGYGASLVTQMTIDNTAPVLGDFVLDLETMTLNVTAQDNEFVSAVVLTNKSGSAILSSAAPNQTVAGAEIEVQLDMTSVTGKTFLLGVYDYAMNLTTYEIELELPEIDRPYFTVVDYQESSYYGIDADGNAVRLANGSDRGLIMAAEFVDGYVFEIAQGGRLYVAEDSDLNSFDYIGELDPTGEWGITNFLDLAYNYADGQLYGLFYSDLNGEWAPLLCTIDLFTGEMEVLLEMPLDVNNMAIDDEGNFYSVSYGYPSLYTYTLEGIMNGQLTYIGEIGYYGTGSFNSLAWDHDADKLYWAYPNTLLEIDPQTAEPTLLSYFMLSMVGLYIRPETYNPDRFAPTDNVVGVELDYSENRVLVGSNVLLSATVLPWNVSDDSIVWTSADESIATVDQNGMVTGVSVGTTVITATSKLVPTMTASCTVEVITLEKKLNGLIWDTDGKIWWSEFEVSELPNFTKLQDTPVPEYLAATAFTPDGLLYASSSDLSTGNLSSSLFTVDPETFEITKIGDSEYGYSDIAYAPHLNGGSIMGTYGSSLLAVDPSTGEMYGHFQMFMYGLNAVAYAGSDRYQEYGFDTYIDWFFLIDTQGYVYLMGFLGDGAGGLYYLEHPATDGGIFAVINYNTDVPYFGSAHFDGEFLYWSVYNESKDVSTLFAVDTVGSRKIYNLGNFGAGVWPAGGLMELDNPTAGMSMNGYELTMEPKAVDSAQSSDPEKLSVSEAAAPAVLNKPNAIMEMPIVDLMSVGQLQGEDGQITVQVTTSDIATNGSMQVTYDTTALELVGVTGVTEAFAYTVSDGVIEIAYAEASALAADTTVATLVFTLIANGDNTITVKHGELNESISDMVEELTIHTHVEEILPGREATCTEPGLTEGKKCAVCGEILVVQEEIPVNSHEYGDQGEITAPTCNKQGYTTYTCIHCGESYVTDYIDALGHTYVETKVIKEATCTKSGEKEFTCTGCGEKIREVTDPIGHSYEAVVTEPTCTEAGSITYTCAHCGDTYTEEIPMIEHSFVDGACTECGEKQIILGDVNGDGKIDTTDAKLIMQYDLGMLDETGLDLSVSDVNGDGLIDTTDAKLIMQLDLGLITEFPTP